MKTKTFPGKKKLIVEVSLSVFMKLIKRAKVEDLFVRDDGWVDLKKLLSFLIETYAEGLYYINQKGFERKKEERKV